MESLPPTSTPLMGEPASVAGCKRDTSKEERDEMFRLIDALEEFNHRLLRAATGKAQVRDADIVTVREISRYLTERGVYYPWA